MDESLQRELASLRALLAKYGPANVLGAVGALCAEVVQSGSVSGDEAATWVRVAMGAQDVARAALGGVTTNEDGDDNEEADDGDEGEELDDADASPASAQAEDAPRVASSSPPVEATPEDAPHAAEPNPAEPPVAPHETSPSEEPTMARDSGVGPRPVDATHWRCRRANAQGALLGERLFFVEGAIRNDEWPIKSCSLDTIRERWGAGLYVIQYIRVDEKNRRRPIGRSRILDLLADAGKGAPVESPPAHAPVAAAMPNATAIPMPFPPLATSGESPLSTVFTLMTYMNEQAERVRAVAEAKERLAVERSTLEAKLALDRHKADLDFQMERMRLESAEKIALAQSNAQLAGRRAPAPALDADELANKLGVVLRGAVNPANFDDEDEDDDETDAPAPVGSMSDLAKIVESLAPTLATIVQEIIAGRKPSKNASNETRHADAAE